MTGERRRSPRLGPERSKDADASLAHAGLPARARDSGASCFLLVLVFEFSNGFHDTANAVATVIYTNSLRPSVAVVWIRRRDLYEASHGEARAGGCARC